MDMFSAYNDADLIGHLSSTIDSLQQRGYKIKNTKYGIEVVKRNISITPENIKEINTLMNTTIKYLDAIKKYFICDSIDDKIVFNNIMIIKNEIEYENYEYTIIDNDFTFQVIIKRNNYIIREINKSDIWNDDNGIINFNKKFITNYLKTIEKLQEMVN